MEHNKKLHNVIFVSDRIITYKSAAAILNLDVNETKAVLKIFVANIRQKNETIGITYVVGGTTVNKHKLVIVAENKYEQTKSKFDQVTIDHIYSVQKSETIDWVAVFNVDDSLYEDKNVDVKNEIKTEIETEIAKPKVINKKGSINSFFSQNQNSKPKTTKQETDTKAEKNAKNINGWNQSAKSSFMSNFISKSNNKENVTKELNKSKKVAISDEDDDEDIGIKKSKKRARIINDDDDDLPESKSPKIDILDDDDDNDDVVDKSENESSEDIFGSPEKDAELSGPETMAIEESQEATQTTGATEKDTETSSQTETDASDMMYEDAEGYFVTEKTPASKKRKLDKVPDQLNDAKNHEKIKEEKQVKKELTQKLKKDTNQKTLFNFFKKM